MKDKASVFEIIIIMYILIHKGKNKHKKHPGH